MSSYASRSRPDEDEAEADSSSFPVDLSSPYVRAGLHASKIVLLHPMDYAKTLIQIGHEPLSPRPTKTWLGKPALGLPNVFQYIGIIKRRDGLSGLYAGLGPRLLSLGAQHLAVEHFNEKWPAPPTDEDLEKKLGRPLTDDELQQRLAEQIKRDSALQVTVVLATQPLTVLAVRSMAQFVGKEDKYKGLLGGVSEVLNENGILGLWQGWFPRAVGEVLLVVLSSSLTYLVNKHIITDKDMQKYTGSIANFIASSFVYPFTVVSNCMVVSRSGLLAGYPPNMPLYQTWTDCFSHLKTNKQLKRGSSLLFRYYTGPQVVVGDRAIPVGSRQ